MTAKVLSISDLHVGNRKTSAKHILTSFRLFFDNYQKGGVFSDIDMLVIAGDFFDNELGLASQHLDDVATLVTEIIDFCECFQITLRVLEGTRRHDWEQSRVFATFYRLKKATFDFKYVATLSIEYIERIKSNVLYVPDEWRHTTEATKQEVIELLKQHGLTKVEIAVMHGMFQFQLGNIPNNPKVHDEAFYLSIVSEFITIGHVHTFMQYERITAQGSFDRIAQGEEGPKGGVLFTQMEDGSWLPMFVENKNAKIYKSVLIETDDLAKAVKQLDKVIEKLPQYSEVRLVAKKGHAIFQSLPELRSRFLYTDFTIKELDDEKAAKKETLIVNDYTPIILSKTSLIPAIVAEVEERKLLPEADLRILKSILGQVHEHC